MKICHLLGAMPPTFAPKLEKNDYLIGVDGGYSYLKSYELTANLVVGDYDSLGFVPKNENLIELPCEKDETDMEYAVKLGLELGYQHFLIQGGLGGRLDHSVANFHLLYTLAQGGNVGILMGDEQNVMIIQNKTITFPPSMTGYLSIFPFEGMAEGVFLENLRYSAEDLSLVTGVPLGVSNEFLPNQPAKISVGQGALQLMWQGEGSQELYERILQGISP